MGYHTTQKPLCSLSILLNGMRFISHWVSFWFYDLSRLSPSPHPFRHHHDSYCMPHDWRKSWRPYHARTPCGQLQRQRETAKRLFRHMTPSQLCILSVNNSLIRYETCNTTMTNIDFSDILFCFVSFLLGLSRIRFQFIRIGDFCRLGSYTGDNTPPSSYSPSCPSQTLQSPSVTSPSDRRRPLGLCQDWVMREQCWTVTRQKKTLETRWVRRVNLGCLSLIGPFLLGKNMPG